MGAPPDPLTLADLILAGALAAVFLAFVVLAVLAAVRDLRAGRWPCPHCGRRTCDRGCVERGED